MPIWFIDPDAFVVIFPLNPILFEEKYISPPERENCIQAVCCRAYSVSLMVPTCSFRTTNNTQKTANDLGKCRETILSYGNVDKG